VYAREDTLPLADNCGAAEGREGNHGRRITQARAREGKVGREKKKGSGLNEVK